MAARGRPVAALGRQQQRRTEHTTDRRHRHTAGHQEPGPATHAEIGATLSHLRQPIGILQKFGLSREACSGDEPRGDSSQGQQCAEQPQHSGDRPGCGDNPAGFFREHGAGARRYERATGRLNGSCLCGAAEPPFAERRHERDGGDLGLGRRGRQHRQGPRGRYHHESRQRHDQPQAGSPHAAARGRGAAGHRPGDDRRREQYEGGLDCQREEKARLHGHRPFFRASSINCRNRVSSASSRSPPLSSNSAAMPREADPPKNVSMMCLSAERRARSGATVGA